MITAGSVYGKRADLSQQIAEDYYRSRALRQARQAQSLRLMSIGSRLMDAYLMQPSRRQPMFAAPIRCTAIQRGSFANIRC